MAKATGKPHKAGTASLKNMIEYAEEREGTGPAFTLLNWALGRTGDKACKSAIRKISEAFEIEEPEEEEEPEEA